MPTIGAGFFRRHIQTIAFIVVIAGGVILYMHAVTSSPAGFYLDESSIAYNAHLIAQTGHDEHGEAWPLFFRAFGEYKNPIYIYLLAAVFRVTGPAIWIARLFSATLGLAGATLIGVLAWRITRRQSVALLVTATALLTPWLFHLSRVVIEVALYPLLIALLLLVVHVVSARNNWGWKEGIALAAALALVTYAYSIGRLLGPLLAVGLLVFVKRVGVPSVLRVWAMFGLSFIPMFIFQQRHPGALSARYRLIAYITPQTSYLRDAWEFSKHFLGNINPWRFIAGGDPNPDQIASVHGARPILVVTLILVVASVFLLIRERRLNPWWRFVLYGLAASFVPASLTRDYFHTLRLAPVPVFMLVLTIPACEWMLTTRNRLRAAILITTIGLIVIQGMVFQMHFRASARLQRRLDLFDADYPTRILPTAMAAAANAPIYLTDTEPIPGYIQARWYGMLQKIPRDKFVLVAPTESAPDGGVVISTEDTCARCTKLYYRWPYTVYVAKGPPRKLQPLPPEGFHAEIHVIDSPSTFAAGEQSTINVMVKNTSPVVWQTRERLADNYQVNVGNHWLDGQGKTAINDDGRATLLYDLFPGQEARLSLIVNAPKEPGRYILELDMVQENLSWFALRGSLPVRLPVTVE